MCIRDRVTAALDTAEAAPELRNKALKPLQDIRKHVEHDPSIPSILMQQQMAVDERDIALDLIDSAKAVKPGTPPGPPPKPIREIRASEFAAKTHLETEEEVEQYIATLRQELLAAIAANCRIRIR